MIIPSIDLMNGSTVQLVGGKDKALDAGDPLPIAERFGLCGDIAVVDLDAALGKGSNASLIDKIIRVAPCRVGGGIRDLKKATQWLDAGARKIVLGTAATPELLGQLPKDRLIAALDAVEGEVVVEGWQKKTGHSVIERMQELKNLVSGFLVTFVEREGRMQGTKMELIKELVAAGAPARLTIAGGVTTGEEIAAIDQLKADAQVGMALYTGRLDFAWALASPLRSDRPDGLWPTVICDEHGIALGLAWSNVESLRQAIDRRKGVYHSRSRGLWVKGEESGATQELLRISLDCDRDCLRFMVRQKNPGFCHRKTRTCWGESEGLFSLERTLNERKLAAPDGSYTKKLLDDPKLLQAKILEEAKELAEARKPGEVAWEAADLFYFAMVALARAGVGLAQVERELNARSLKVSRRIGEAKK